MKYKHRVIIGIFYLCCFFCTFPVKAEDYREKILPPINLQPEQLSIMPKILILHFKIRGNTVFSTFDLSAIASKYENREITSVELEQLRKELTLMYVNKGYISSGVIIPDQRVVNGEIELVVIEGKLTGIEITGNKYFRSGYISKRLFTTPEDVANIYHLQEALLLLQQDTRFKRIKAEFKPGARMGESIIAVDVEENTPYKFGFEISNTISPSIGGKIGKLFAAHQNLTGNGDVLTLMVGAVPEHANNNVMEFTYTLPVNAYGTTIGLEYKKNESMVTEEPFNELDIKAVTETYGIVIRHPFYKKFDREFAIGLRAENRQTKTYVLDRPFNFELAAEDGKTVVVPLRFFQDFNYRSRQQVFVLRSTFSFGINAMDASMLPSGADGKFFSWLGQLQWIRRLGNTDWQFFFRTDSQLSRDPLLGIEKFSVGGLDTVRGYRENCLVRDNGLVSSVELRIPLYQNNEKDRSLQLVPFFDYGRSWNTNQEDPDPSSISSVGIGLRGKVANNINAEFFYGYALRTIDYPQKDIQDQGIHFRLIVNLF